MSESKSPSWKSQAEKLLQTLKDVVGAGITLDTDGDVADIQIMAEGQRPFKQIIRDVRSALKAEYQMDVDYQRIHVSQRLAPPGSDEPGNILTLPRSAVMEEPTVVRIQFASVTTSQELSRCHVRVELVLGDRRAMGEAEGANSRGRIPRVVAEAALDAVSRFLDETHELFLADLQTTSIAGQDVVLVGVTFIKDREEKVLTGVAPVGQGLQQAIVYATLDALNRILGRLSYKEPVEFELRPTGV